MVVTSTVRAQTDTKKEKEAAELEKKTLALLNEVASASWGLKLPENRVYIMASTADLLWPFDDKRARNLYWEALNSINQSNPKTNESLSKADREKILQSYFLNLRLRQTILRKVARRDSQLALDMLRATRQVPPKELGPDGSFSQERQLEQEIAGEIAARDPAYALQLARESLAKGLTLELVNLLQRLQQRDSEKATLFAGDMITKLQTANVATDFRASIIALYLVQDSRAREWRTGELKPLSLTDDQKRGLIEILTSAALSTITIVMTSRRRRVRTPVHRIPHLEIQALRRALAPSRAALIPPQGHPCRRCDPLPKPSPCQVVFCVAPFLVFETQRWGGRRRACRNMWCAAPGAGRRRVAVGGGTMPPVPRGATPVSALASSRG